MCKENKTKKQRKIIGDYYPELVKEWHPTKNGELTPHQVTHGSKKKVWWLCREDQEHEWEATIRSRCNGTGCPFCSGLKVPKSKRLMFTHPLLVKEWHPTKNENLTPMDVSYGTHKKVWWLCSKGHQYITKVSNRTFSGTGCPYCSNHKLCLENSLAIVKPEIAREWHPAKNGELTPYDVMCGTNKKVWWKCNNNYDYQQKIKNRSRGVECPHCLKERAKEDNRLITLFPDLINEWHPTKNEKRKLEDLTYGTLKIVWWKCKEGHEFTARVADRTMYRCGCPYCSGQKPTKENNLGVLYPELIKEWHPKKKRGFNAI